MKPIRYFVAYAARRKRDAMRGHLNLKRNGNLGRVEDILHALSSTELEITQRARFSFFGSGVGVAEKVVRQYLLLQLGGVGFKRKLLSVLGAPDKALVHPLPKSWSQTLLREGVKVATVRSAILWTSYLVGTFAYAVFAMGKSIALSFLRQSDRGLQNTAYFAGISAAQLPRDEQPTFDIFSWYASQADRRPNLIALTHSVNGGKERRAKDLPLYQVGQPQPLPKTWSSRVRLCHLYLELIAQAFVDLFRGRWWHALLLREAERAALIRVAAPDDLASEYLFSNSDWLYRPLWTYAAETAGSLISFYFYSTNAAVFKTPSGYPRQTNHWELCTWSRYLVWEHEQESFLRRLGLTGEIKQVGPIWFSDMDGDLPEFSPPAIAVFDVQPMRNVIYRSLALSFEYYTAPTGVKFAEDVCGVAESLNVAVLWKRKRNIGRNAHPLYAKVMNRLTEEGLVIPVEPGLAAQHIIDNVQCVISMPFTSTALLARSMNKPSCYYDPTGLIQSDDRSAYGIVVLTSPEELKDWIASNLVL